MSEVSSVILNDHVQSNCLSNGQIKKFTKNVSDFDKVDIKKTDPSDKKAKKKKIIIGALIGAAAVATAAVLIYKHKQVKVLKNMPEELKGVFEGVKHKEGKEFIDSAYDGLKKYMDLEDFAPKNVILTDDPDGIFNTIKGGYNFLENKIEYTKGFQSKLTKSQQFNMLSHELKHCKQLTDILRTEGLGSKAISEAYTNQTLNSTQGLFNGGKSFIEIMKEEFSPQEASKLIAEKKAQLFEDFMKKIEANYSDVLEKAKKYAPNSPEGLHAKEYLEAIKNYEGLGLFGFGSDKYRSNLLEVEAYGFGEKMEKFFNSKTSIFSKIKDYVRVLIANK